MFEISLDVAAWLLVGLILVVTLGLLVLDWWPRR
jgi:hypothetical protein